MRKRFFFFVFVPLKNKTRLIDFCITNSERVLLLVDDWNEHYEHDVKMHMLATCSVVPADVDFLLHLGMSSPRLFIKKFFGEWDAWTSAITLLLCLKNNPIALPGFYRDLRSKICSPILYTCSNISEQAQRVRALLARVGALADWCSTSFRVLKFVCSIVAKLERPKSCSDLMMLLVNQLLETSSNTEALALASRKLLRSLAWRSFQAQSDMVEIEDWSVWKSTGLLVERGGKLCWVNGLVRAFFVAEYLCMEEHAVDVAAFLREAVKDTSQSALISLVCSMGGRAVEESVLESWFPSTIAEPKRRKMADSSLVIWIEDAGERLTKVLRSTWLPKMVKEFGPILLRTAGFEACEDAFLFFAKACPELLKKESGLLLCAAGGGSAKICQKIVESGGNVEGRVDGWTAFLLACNRGFLDVAKYLLEVGANPKDCLENGGMSAIWLASQEGKIEILDFLLRLGVDVNVCDSKQRTPLFVACKNGHAAAAQLLLDHGANPHIFKHRGTSPLYFAARNGHYLIVKMLIERGANLHAAKSTGTAPIFVACQEGRKDVVDLLLKHGADPNSRKTGGWTCLMVRLAKLFKKNKEKKRKGEKKITLTFEIFKIAARNNHLKIVDLLLAQNCDVNATSIDGTTALYYASLEGHSEIVRRLLSCGAFVGRKRSGRTPLFVASKNSHFEVVCLLLEHGASVDEVDDRGITAFFAACYRRKLEIAEKLLEYGANVNCLDVSGRTPLMIAAMFGAKDVVEFLLLKGADCRLVALNGMNAYDFASIKGYADVALLLKHDL